MKVSEPFVLTMLVVMPLFLMAFFKPIAGLALQSSGIQGASGWQQSVPGMMITFGFFVVGIIAFSAINERTWGTWEQLRMFTSHSYEILAGKIISPMLLCLGQIALLFALAMVLFGLTISSYGVLVAVSVCLCACIVTMGLATAGVCRTLPQANIISNLAVVGFGCLGGAFLPLHVLPGWAQAVAPVTPTYWAMRGYSVSLLPSNNSPSWAWSCAVLLAFSVTFAAVAAWTFRIGESRMR
ncbi:MAG: ABC transporter permease [Acidimicrobiales bacterium]